MAINPLTGLEEQDELTQDTPMPTSDELVKQYFQQQMQARGPANADGSPGAPTMNPMVKEYLTKKFNFGDYSDENRKKLEADSQLGFGDKAGAALAAIGAGFMGKDAAAAGQGKLKAAKDEKMGKLASFDKGRQGMIEQYRLDKEATTDSQAQEKLAREMDPSSEESKMAQDLAKSMGYKGDTSKLTAQQFQAFSPALQKKYEIAEKALDRQERSKDRALQRESMMSNKELARQDKLDKEAKLSDKQVGQITEFDDALSSIDSIKRQKDDFDTGPVSAAQSKLAGLVGIDDSKKSAFKAQVQDDLARYIKSISGGAVSDEERAFLIQNLPTMSDNDETFKAKLDVVEKRLQRNRDNFLSNTEKSGKNVSQFKRESSSSYPKTVRKGNQTATVSSPEEEAEAKAEGFM